MRTWILTTLSSSSLSNFFPYADVFKNSLISSKAILISRWELNRKKKEILLANKEFYDKTAAVYDLADGRRSPKLEKWLSLRLKKLANKYGNKNFLDLGCGTGFVMKCARKYFKNIVGVDISEKILQKAKEYGQAVCADINQLPFANKSFNVICSFATLHHCVDTRQVFQESYRVLKDGGGFYTDHDLEKHFAENFKPLLSLYRFLRNPCRRYAKLVKNLNESLYKKCEFHSEGLDAQKISDELKKVGFVKIKESYHWFGLNPLTDWIFGERRFKQGLAPLLSIEAVK